MHLGRIKVARVKHKQSTQDMLGRAFQVRRSCFSDASESLRPELLFRRFGGLRVGFRVGAGFA